MTSKGFVTCALSGGIGNQLFQIAFAYSLSKELDVELIVSLTQFTNCGQGSHPSKYYSSLYSKLNFLNTLLPITSYVEDYSFAYNPKIEEQLKNLKNECKFMGLILIGPFQSEKYFEKYKKEIINLYTPKCGMKIYLQNAYRELSEKFKELFIEDDVENRCLIGIRRGDYMKNLDFYVPCHMTYYEDAISEMGENKTFYIASDDFDWCKENFKGKQYKFFDITDDLPQLLISTLFKNYIISNSTFHWWGSYLSIYEKPRIIAPDIWINDAGYRSIYRPEMEIIKRKVLF
jgi:hypothetical protein